MSDPVSERYSYPRPLDLSTVSIPAAYPRMRDGKLFVFKAHAGGDPEGLEGVWYGPIDDDSLRLAREKMPALFETEGPHDVEWLARHFADELNDFDERFFGAMRKRLMDGPF